MNTDECLIRRISNGEKKALSDLYDRYYRLIWNMACTKYKDQIVCEQLVCEVFQTIWKYPNDFRGNRKFIILLIECCRSKIDSKSYENK